MPHFVSFGMSVAVGSLSVATENSKPGKIRPRRHLKQQVGFTYETTI